jgi:hypothetical protein
MPETFNPVTLQNGAGQPLNAAYFNRLETGIELLDDRAAALELGIYTPVDVPFATSITLNATQGALFRCTATGDFTLDGIVGGTNGQTVVFEVVAQGGTRSIAFTDDVDSVSIPPGSRWSGTFRYSVGDDSWLLIADDGGGGVGTVTTADVSDFTEGTQDAIAPLFTGGVHSGISFVYDDANSRINATVVEVTTVSVNIQTGTTYTLVLSDAGKVVEMHNSSTNTVTIPNNTSVAFPVGTILEVFQYGAGTTSVAAASGVTILPGPSPTPVLSRYQSLSLRKRAANEWVVA